CAFVTSSYARWEFETQTASGSNQKRRNTAHSKRFARLGSSLMKFAPALAVTLFLLGCKGVPIGSERRARAQAQEVAARYRPSGQKPPLPLLATNSSLSAFLTYAMLNQPNVEAAYYDWLASIERITTARSLPDPQLTFQ